MFIGHFAIGFAAKRAAPRTSLATLLTAAVWPDVVFSLLLFAGVERVRVDPSVGRYVPIVLEYYPWSHSLVMTALWGVLLATGYLALRRYTVGAWCVLVGVLSHWVLDWASHRPDMPLIPGGSGKYGLGLYDSPGGTAIIESLLFAGGVWLCASANRPRDAVGRWGLVGLIAVLALMYGGSFLMPPPPDARAMSLANDSMIFLLPWAGRVDRHREVVA